ncbi:MAG: SDR family oxidoreductase [Lentisphaeria bacterium]|nr:SDR family oxidoreductase [Lentisphaeria bacterium]
MKLLLTGITGLVGAAFVTETIRNRKDVEITAICRSGRGESAEDRVKKVIREQSEFDGTPEIAEEVLRHVTVIDGNILDLPVDEIVAKGPYDELFHCAADVNLGKDPNGTVFKTNMQGTVNMLDLARTLKVKALHYVGTAYVAGKCVGLVKEDELSATDFNNSYERSKCEAEKLVRACGIPYTVYRPGIIVGRLSDGRIRKPLAFYRIMEFLGVVKKHHCAKLGIPANSVLDCEVKLQSPLSDRIYFTPIDYVQKAISRLFSLPVQNKGYHLTGESPVSTVMIAEAMSSVLKMPNLGVTKVQQEENADEKLIRRMIADLMPYFETRITFDNTSIKAALGPEILNWKLDVDFLKRMAYSYYKQCSPELVQE